MKTGIQLITEERQKQIAKWGTTDAHDVSHDEGELKTAALFALTGMKEYEQFGFEEFEEKLEDKNELARLRIAGALIAAQMDYIIQNPSK